MGGNVIALLVGIICVILGISNMRGHIESLHSYHRDRVSEQDRLPFGRKVGLGTVLIGAAIIVFSILSTISVLTGQQVYLWIGFGVMITGLVVGTIIAFRAMIRYNGGIF